uniref:Uncharacterized protein n=1 Tax=viral metagenome TaxID=1070528 RepID=A0A6C0DCB7_9ZZZZ
MNILFNLAHYGDIIAIPGFLLLSYYFYKIENRTFLENFLLFGSLCGFILDSFFTYIFFFLKKSKSRH